MKPNCKLILDFDDVLFNTKGLKENMFTILHEEGVVSAEELYDTERQSGRPFVMKDFLKRAYSLTIEGGDTFVEVDIDVVYEKIMKSCLLFVNEELVEVLTLVGKENCYIVSNGYQEYQKDKIVRTGVDKFVREVIIVPGTKSVEIAKICSEFPDNEILFIDDKNMYFDDIDYSMCKNLKTILYRGKEGLSEIKNEIRRIQVPENQQSVRGGPSMK